MTQTKNSFKHNKFLFQIRINPTLLWLAPFLIKVAQRTHFRCEKNNITNCIQFDAIGYWQGIESPFFNTNLPKISKPCDGASPALARTCAQFRNCAVCCHCLSRFCFLDRWPFSVLAKIIFSCNCSSAFGPAA